MNRIHFRLEIEPKSLQKSGKRIRIIPNRLKPGKFLPMHFASKEAEAFKHSVATLCAPHRPAAPLEGPLRLTLVFVMPRPQRLCRPSDPAGRILCDTRPDNVNLCKGFEDVLTAARFWHDDNQVAMHSLAKVYARRDESPSIEVTIETLSEFLR